MATADALHPDQLAVLQLVLRRGMSYAELGSALGLDAGVVRERALDAIDGLAPDDRPGLTLEDRDRIGDHLLGQQDEAASSDTTALLASSAPAREWADEVQSGLDGIGGARATAATAAAPAAAGSGDEVRDAFAALDRGRDRPKRTGRRGRTGTAVIAGIAAILIVVVVLAVAGVFSSDSSSSDASDDVASTPSTASTSTTPDAQTLLAPLKSTIRLRTTSSTPASYRGASATVRPALAGSTPVLGLKGTGFRVPTRSWTYGVWLTGGGQDPTILTWFSRGPKIDQGTTSTVSANGDVQEVPVPLESSTSDGQTRTVEPGNYTRILITREPATSTRAVPTKPGTTILSGELRR